uniref:uncharacterized protein LOC128931208 n=1 Tax=Callithrix jacchus TaxID=9483 RepID=UPI0023DD1062
MYWLAVGRSDPEHHQAQAFLTVWEKLPWSREVRDGKSVLPKTHSAACPSWPPWPTHLSPSAAGSATRTPPNSRLSQSVTHSSLPIVASLANSAVSFSCRISYPYTPQFKAFTVSYFHEDLHGRRSPEKPTNCHPGLGIENQTYALNCLVTLVPLDTSATGTYYCSVNRPHPVATGSGTFIPEREADAGSTEGSHQEVPSSKICQQPQTASYRIRLHKADAGSTEGSHQEVPSSKICQQPQTASYRIRLH